jgi:hypothetical protein
MAWGSGNAPRGTSSKTPNYNGRGNSGGNRPSGLGRYKDEQIAELTAKVWRLESSAFPPLPPPLPLRYSAVTAAPLQTAHATTAVQILLTADHAQGLAHTLQLMNEQLRVNKLGMAEIRRHLNI